MGLDEKTLAMLRMWLAAHHGDVERAARWAARNLRRIAGVKQWRAWFREVAS
ncbi:MAG: hypothetical protein JNM17_06720 [Archangium sp.]|nr:hypothetical protein [Archangium sp.]